MQMLNVSLLSSDENGVSLSHEDFASIISFIAAAFTDVKEISDNLAYLDELLGLKKCWGDNGIVYGASVRLLAKLTDEETKNMLKKTLQMGDITSKYEDLFNQIKAI